MTTTQQAAVNKTLHGLPITAQAQVGNGIDQVLAGTWTCERLKQHPAWQGLPQDAKTHLSGLLDKWLYERDGGKGCANEVGIKAYFKPDRNLSSTIMPQKLNT